MQPLLFIPIAFGAGVAVVLPSTVDSGEDVYSAEQLDLPLVPTIIFDQFVMLHMWALVVCCVLFGCDALTLAAAFYLSIAYTAQTHLDRKVRFWYTHRSYVGLLASIVLWLAMAVHVVRNTTYITLHWSFIARTLCSIADAYQFHKRIKFNN